ncbi:calcium-binding protein [Couchioplanes caeruleus]|uniref:calcium-binding protein n=1 Tax=Couchioplanes caeruleus TaxID=56438 RepID=UPI0020C09938|nr:calcium-binding protein [Couchioplanes caeruleus]UQU64761.1 calcium-binding protein [Couchioplanes caeruleus]
MFVFHRKALAGIGVTVAAVASTALFQTPAQAATAGLAKVVGSSTVQFNALMGKANGLTITISGRTVTLDDKVAIKAGSGCKAVKHDKTKVKCTTSRKVTKLSVALGDKNDWVTNKTSVYLLADGGTGNDTLTGGSGNDQLQGAAGNDKLYGKNGKDKLFGGAGNDRLYGAAGNDQVSAGAGTDNVYGDDGNDTLLGDDGNDTVYGGAGIDQISGGPGNDTIYAGAGDDTVTAGTGNDKVTAAAGADIVVGDAGADVLSGDAGADIILGEAGNDQLAGGDGDDIVFGKDGNDVVTGGNGDDALVGEDLLEDGTAVGSDSALDRLDGGANITAEGDFCVVLAGGTAVNCELVAPAASASASGVTAATPEVQTAAQIARRAAAAVAVIK